VMSIAHHQEVINEHMNDSNWWKMTRIGKHLFYMYHCDRLKQSAADSLCEKWTQAMKGLSEMRPIFEQLSDSLDASLVQEWTVQERIAMEECGDHLNIYQVKLGKCRRFIYSSIGY